MKKNIILTSPQPNMGKTVLAGNLAGILLAYKQSATLIDCDLSNNPYSIRTCVENAHYPTGLTVSDKPNPKTHNIYDTDGKATLEQLAELGQVDATWIVLIDTKDPRKLSQGIERMNDLLDAGVRVRALLLHESQEARKWLGSRALKNILPKFDSPDEAFKLQVAGAYATVKTHPQIAQAFSALANELFNGLA